MTRGDPPIGRISASAYNIPIDAPEDDGTLEWDTTIVIVGGVNPSLTIQAIALRTADRIRTLASQGALAL